MNPDRPLVIALLVASADPALIVPGAEQRRCALCDRDVWLAPSSLRVGEIDINCVRCAAGRDDLRDVTSIGLAPGAMDEVRAATEEPTP